MQDNEAKWFFSPIMGGQEDGPNDPVLNHFEGDYEQSIVREIIQNSIDARRSKDKPVLVKFRLSHISPSDIPEISTLKDSIEKSRQYSSKDARYKAFCDQALSDLNKQSMPVLTVGDYNTNGLEGDFDSNNSSLFKLVKAVGTNDQTGVGGGSYGIGKGAPFVASKLRTILYSSHNIHDEFIFTGSSRLSTFEQTENNRVRGVGFYEYVKDIRDDSGQIVNKTTHPLRNDAIPQLFKRDDYGTDIVILDYKIPEENDWDINLVAPILNNFWVAIVENDLIVELKEDGETKQLINSDTIDSLIDKFSRKQTYNDECKDVYKYFDAYKNPDNDDTVITINKLGECRLYVSLDDNGTNCIDSMRAPKMNVNYLAMRSPEHFSAVFICDNPEGNRILRSMEPPNHKTWDPKLAKGCSTIILNIKEAFRQIIKALTPEEENEVTDIPGLNEYLPEDDEGFYKKTDGNEATGKENNKETALETPISSFTQMKPTSSSRSSESSYLDITSNGGGQTPTSGEPGGSIHGELTDHNGPDEDGNGYKLINNKVISYRYIKPNTNLPDLFKLKISSLEDQDCSFRLIAIGDDNTETLTIKSAIDKYGNNILTADKRIHVILKANIPEVIEVSIVDGKYKKIIKVAA